MSPKRDNDDNKQLTRKDRATQPMDHGRLSNMKKKLVMQIDWPLHNKTL